ncbi:MAG: ATP-binding protein, partial [Holdemanella sp.]|nr:ATP-binding protein [Holdemanella sp.]
MNLGFESEYVEFKLTTGERKEALESICAILNKHTEGTLYFGVDDRGNVKGQQVSDSTKRDISRWISESIDPKITATIETFPILDKQYIKVSFYGYNRPYNVNGTFFTRIGTENKKMSTDELRRLIKNEDYSSHWDEKTSMVSQNDIDENALKDFY